MNRVLGFLEKRSCGYPRSESGRVAAECKSRCPGIGEVWEERRKTDCEQKAAKSENKPRAFEGRGSEERQCGLRMRGRRVGTKH